MKKLDIRKDLYNCCPLLNKECTKENCYINNGPCRLTCDYNQSQEYLIEKTKLFHKNGVFSLEFQEEIERLNNIINECAEDILKELEENHHLSYGVALAIRQKLLDYKELKGSENNE